MTELLDVELVEITADVVVDKEFSELIPPLSADERRELEASLVQHGGARDPLIAWNQTPPILLDGHNRLEICQRLGLPYVVKGIKFANREQARKWVERNQLGRRNLTRQDFTIVLGRLYNRTKNPVGGRRGDGERTREKFAKEYGVDPRTVDRAGAFQAAAEKLGVEREIATGRLRVPVPQLVSVAKSLPENPPRDIVTEALRNAKKKPRQDKPASQSWLVPANPDDCLRAIKFYAKTFVWQAEGSIDALNNLLAALIEENRQHSGLQK